MRVFGWRRWYLDLDSMLCLVYVLVFSRCMFCVAGTCAVAALSPHTLHSSALASAPPLAAAALSTGSLRRGRPASSSAAEGFCRKVSSTLSKSQPWCQARRCATEGSRPDTSDSREVTSPTVERGEGGGEIGEKKGGREW